MWNQQAALSYPALQEMSMQSALGVNGSDSKEWHSRWWREVLNARAKGQATDEHAPELDETREFSEPGDVFDENKHDWFDAPNCPGLKHRGASRLARASRQYLNINKEGVSLGNCPHPEDTEVMHGSSLLRLRARIFVTLQDSDASVCTFCIDEQDEKNRVLKQGYRISIFMLLAILASTVSLCLDTIPTLKEQHHIHYSIAYIEMLCIICFTVEFLLKAACAPDLRNFWLDTMNLIDLASFLPWYIDRAFCDAHPCTSSSSLKITQVLRVLRLVRVFRILKLGAHFHKFQVLTTALKESWDVMMMLVFILGIIITLFSALIYQTERNRAWAVSPETGQRVYFDYDKAGNLSSVPGLEAVGEHLLHGGQEFVHHQFSSIPATFWFMIVTLMTVGYGDMYPTTILGQCVTAVAMVLSMMVLALPISVIGTNFTQAWMDQKERDKRGRTDNLTPSGIPQMATMMAAHIANVNELAHKLRAASLELGSEFGHLSQRIQRTHYDCMTMIQQVETNEKLKETLEATKSFEQDLLEHVLSHEQRIDSLCERIIDLMRVSDLMQNVRSSRWPCDANPSFLNFRGLLDELQSRTALLSTSGENSVMIGAKIMDLEVAMYEAAVMTDDVGDVVALNARVNQAPVRDGVKPFESKM